MNHAEKVAYLSQYKQMDAEIDRKIHEVDVWKRRTAGLEPDDRAQVRVIRLLRSINDEIDRLVDFRESLRRSIAKLDDRVLRTLLEYRYIDGMGWEELADKMVYSYQHVFRLHKKALELLELEEDVMDC